MQIIVTDCDNKRPDLIIPADLCVEAGTLIETKIFGIDADSHPVKIEVSSEVLNFLNSPASYTPKPAVFQSSSPSAQLNFRWQTDCDHVKEQYYHVVFKITDKSPEGTNLVTFKTWKIKVVGPRPVWNDVTLVEPRTVLLTWESYECANADSLQIWRRVAAINFMPTECETGMPDDLGYSLVTTLRLGANVTQFNDQFNFAPGATYCYRLVAKFPKPKNGESYVSMEMCLLPIVADAPVITNVSVDRTDPTSGAIRVRWTSPLQIDKVKYPGPYEYEVFRGRDFEGEPYTRITPSSHIADTTFIDDFIDTENFAYHYYVVLYSNTIANPSVWQAIDTSAVASSVWLEGKGSPEKILLDWQAMVPWSNRGEKFPYHRVYRLKSNEQSDFVLIDSINSLQADFSYVDTGTYKGQPLQKNAEYCYRIMTRGIYGNPLLGEPLENYSQQVCLTPQDQLPPCVPTLSLLTLDCDKLFADAQCDITNFSNQIYWTSTCSSEVKGYNIYSSSGPNNEFVLIVENVRDTFYVDANLSSFARCYKIKAISAQGIESDDSQIVCNDNCPYFELPNVFTPNGDPCNEMFSAYGVDNPYQSNSIHCPLSGDNVPKCLRFVQQVIFKVYNRWGKEIYQYNSLKDELGHYINWDGKNSSGEWLSAGVYYYHATVTFDSIDPEKRHSELKGWVQIVR